MRVYFSNSEGGFYTDTVHGKKMPSDVVEISQSRHVSLLDEQSSGKRIVSDKDGLPIAVDPSCKWNADAETWIADQSAKERALANQERVKRDARIDIFMWRIQRHESELRRGKAPTEPIEPLDEYIQAERDVTSQEGFPSEISFPTPPPLPNH